MILKNRHPENIQQRDQPDFDHPKHRYREIPNIQWNDIGFRRAATTGK
jgi:hypothetical protein